MPEVAAASVAAVLRDATSAFATASDTPRLDAELLLALVLGVDRSRLVIDARAALDGGALARFEALVARRAAGEPVAYILGRKEFRRITLSVDPRVLIPRPETELLVEVGLSLPPGASVVDVGTGSGAVALALASERPDLSVWGTDIDPSALAVARGNGIHLGLGVEFVQADLLDSPRLPERPDAVLANLPYVASGASLPPDVAHYEPAGALFGGPDGLDVIRRLVAQASHVPLVALEVGFDQAQAVAALLRERATALPSQPATALPSQRATALASQRATALPSQRATAVPSQRATALASQRATALPSQRATAPPSQRATALPSQRATALPSQRTNLIEILRDLAGHERVVVRRQ